VSETVLKMRVQLKYTLYILKRRVVLQLDESVERQSKYDAGHD